ncbi:hypothetical protein [Parapedobacter luteus]|uniref:hypothetical protein n=1 Tax=Parapedobacter luteus TaxID=623280 RepID=UPI0011162470|nr:hypothetical protein [Parapedobacter luteus]
MKPNALLRFVEPFVDSFVDLPFNTFAGLLLHRFLYFLTHAFPNLGVEVDKGQGNESHGQDGHPQ